MTFTSFFHSFPKTRDIFQHTECSSKTKINKVLKDKIGRWCLVDGIGFILTNEKIMRYKKVRIKDNLRKYIKLKVHFFHKKNSIILLFI